MTMNTINANTANEIQSTIAAAIEAARAAAAEAAEAAKKAREKAEEADEAETNANSAEDEAENDLYAAENASSEAAEAEERAQTAASEAEEAAREAENASTEAAEAEENAREHAAEATKAANLARTAAAEAAEAAEIAEQAAARAAEAIEVVTRAAEQQSTPELTTNDASEPEPEETTDEESESEPEEHRARCCITETILKRFFPEPIASDIDETQTFMGTIFKPANGKTATLIIDPDLLDREIDWSYPDDPGAFIDLSTGEIITSHERPEEIAAIVDRIIIAAIQQDADRTRIARRDARRRFFQEAEKRADAHDIEYDLFEATTGNPDPETDEESTWYGWRLFESNDPTNSLEIPPANFADPTETAPIFARLETWFFRTAEQRAWEEDE